MINTSDWIWSPSEYYEKKKKHFIKHEEPLYIPASFSNIKWASQSHNPRKKS